MSTPITLSEIQRRVDSVPFHQFLKLTVESIDTERGRVVMRLPYRLAFSRSAEQPQIHGGVTAALIDIAGDYALMALLGYGVPTVNLSVDYLRMAAGDLTATATVVKAGRTMALANVEITDDEQRTIAVGRGNYVNRAG